MSRLTKKVSKMEAMLEYGSEYIPSENCHSAISILIVLLSLLAILLGLIWGWL